MNRVLIIIRGVQGSGKTTLANWILNANEPRALVPSDWSHFEADMFFINPVSGEYQWEAERVGEAHRWCQCNVNRAMEQGRNIIVSNTFVSKEEMKPYLEMAAQHNYIVQTIICQGEFKNVHGVDETKVQKKRKAFQY